MPWHIYVNARAIIERVIENRIEIIVQWRNKKGQECYEFPGGQIEHFESLFSALKREVKEETGLNVVEATGYDYIYDIDKSRNNHIIDADPIYQPTMCRDYVKEYNVSDFWELPSEVIGERERHWLQEFTPMAIIDLIILASKHDFIICEGDIDCSIVIPVASNMIYLSNQGTNFDWFNRPDHSNSLNSIKNRLDLTEKEKDALICNAYNSVAKSEGKIPKWVVENNIKTIVWNNNITIEQTASEVAQYFGFLKNK